MTKTEFIQSKNEETQKLLRDGYIVVMKCDCGEDGCGGWALIPNNRESIEYHTDTYVYKKD